MPYNSLHLMPFITSIITLIITITAIICLCLKKRCACIWCTSILIVVFCSNYWNYLLGVYITIVSFFKSILSTKSYTLDIDKGMIIFLLILFLLIIDLICIYKRKDKAGLSILSLLLIFFVLDFLNFI